MFLQKYHTDAFLDIIQYCNWSDYLCGTSSPFLCTCPTVISNLYSPWITQSQKQTPASHLSTSIFSCRKVFIGEKSISDLVFKHSIFIGNHPGIWVKTPKSVSFQKENVLYNLRISYHITSIHASDVQTDQAHGICFGSHVVFICHCLDQWFQACLSCWITIYYMSLCKRP